MNSNIKPKLVDVNEVKKIISKYNTNSAIKLHDQKIENIKEKLSFFKNNMTLIIIIIIILLFLWYRYKLTKEQPNTQNIYPSKLNYATPLHVLQ